jgi:hypothetical protein
MAVAADCYAKRGTYLRAYRCDVEGCMFGWHLTHVDALPPPELATRWRPPAKSQRTIAREERAERREWRRRRR